MQNIEVMKPLESQSDVDEGPPDGGLVILAPILLVEGYFLVEVAVIEELHHDAEWWEIYQRELASMKECL